MSEPTLPLSAMAEQDGAALLAEVTKILEAARTFQLPDPDSALARLAALKPFLAQWILGELDHAFAFYNMIEGIAGTVPDNTHDQLMQISEQMVALGFDRAAEVLKAYCDLGRNTPLDRAVVSADNAGVAEDPTLQDLLNLCQAEWRAATEAVPHAQLLDVLKHELPLSFVTQAAFNRFWWDQILKSDGFAEMTRARRPLRSATLFELDVFVKDGLQERKHTPFFVFWTQADPKLPQRTHTYVQTESGPVRIATLKGVTDRAEVETEDGTALFNLTKPRTGQGRFGPAGSAKRQSLDTRFGDVAARRVARGLR